MISTFIWFFGFFKWQKGLYFTVNRFLRTAEYRNEIMEIREFFFFKCQGFFHWLFHISLCEQVIYVPPPHTLTHRHTPLSFLTVWGSGILNLIFPYVSGALLARASFLICWFHHYFFFFLTHYSNVDWKVGCVFKMEKCSQAVHAVNHSLYIFVKSLS